MNLAHMKYAVAIAETNSLNQAAQKLYVGQPTLSRAIKELEATLGVAIFERSAKGMFLTPDGELFLQYAKVVLGQVEALESMFSQNTTRKQRFSVSVPRASYISAAFARFTQALDPDLPVELFYKETNPLRVLKNLLREDYKLGILRYCAAYDKYYKSMLEEKDLAYELVAEFRHVLVVGRESPLAGQKGVTREQLTGLMEIVHADPYVPSLPFAEVKKEELPEHSPRRICVFERASQFELLAANPDTFMWLSPTPPQLLERCGLVTVDTAIDRRVYKDLLVHRRDYTLSPLDNLFIQYLVEAKREFLN